MILHPSILALFISSLLISLMTLYACGYGILILRRWDISSGSELQVTLERRTYLISTIISYFLVFQLVSLFLFIQTADSISHLFVGAMCAVGTLTANQFGYPTLALKTLTFLAAGVWLILNHADSRGYDYPLIRPKYLLLLCMAPLVLAETVLQAVYFLRLKPDIITSCCGALFSQTSRGIAAEIVAIPAGPMQIAFCGPGYRFGGVLLRARQGRFAFRRRQHRQLPFDPCRHGLFHLAVHLRDAFAPLPVLHPAEGVRPCRLSPLRAASDLDCHRSWRWYAASVQEQGKSQTVIA